MENAQTQPREVNPRLNSASGGFSYSLLVVIYSLVSFAAGLIIGATKLDAKSDAYIYISYLIAPLIIAACVVTTLKLCKINFKSVFPVKCGYKYYIIALLMVFGLIFSLSWVNEVSVEFFKLFGYEQRESASYFPGLTGGYIVPALLVIAVMPAFFEELMFRGVLLNCGIRGLGSVRVILVTGFCFSLFHGSPEQTVYQFIAGCAFAFVAVRSGSILPSMLMHLINNALIVILQACGAFDAAGSLIISQGANIALTVCGALSLIGAAVWLVLDKKPLVKCEKGGVIAFFKYASAGIAILTIMWFLLLFGVA